MSQRKAAARSRLAMLMGRKRSWKSSGGGKCWRDMLALWFVSAKMRLTMLVDGRRPERLSARISGGIDGALPTSSGSRQPLSTDFMRGASCRLPSVFCSAGTG